MKNMKKQQGFTLIELLIVVAIIAIIAAIAIPNLLTARQAANETSAIGSLRTISSAQTAYSATSNGYYTDIAGLIAGKYLDTRFDTTNGEISGYKIVTTTTPIIGTERFAKSSTANDGDGGYIAVPSTTSSGRYCYGLGPDMVIRYIGSGNYGNVSCSKLPNCDGSTACKDGAPVGGIGSGS